MKCLYSNDDISLGAFVYKCNKPTEGNVWQQHRSKWINTPKKNINSPNIGYAGCDSKIVQIRNRDESATAIVECEILQTSHQTKRLKKRNHTQFKLQLIYLTKIPRHDERSTVYFLSSRDADPTQHPEWGEKWWFFHAVKKMRTVKREN